MDPLTRLCINTEKGELAIDPFDILFLLADRMYTTIVLKCGKKYTVPGSLKSYLEHLKCIGLFVRIHRSHVVNRDAIARVCLVTRVVEIADGTVLPIARRCLDKAKHFFKRI